jgi:hypothetical protein
MKPLKYEAEASSDKLDELKKRNKAQNARDERRIFQNVDISRIKNAARSDEPFSHFRNSTDEVGETMVQLRHI